MIDPDPSDEAVRLQAYSLWEAAGRTHGHDQTDWLQAETMLSPTQLHLDPETMPGAASDPTLVETIREELHEVAELASKAVHFVEELFVSHGDAKKAD